MSKQIAVRLPDEMVEFLDGLVDSGSAPSRAAVISSAVEREMRRLLAEQDARILRDAGPDDDLDAVVYWGASNAVIEG